MKLDLKWVFVSACLLVLTACSGIGKVSNYKQSFTPKIYSDDSKRFEFTMRYQGRVNANRPERYNPESFAKKMNEQLRIELEANEFCRDGYFVIQRYDQPVNAMIQGECRESASAQDHERWPEANQTSK